jgi:hypothetical protein
MHGREEASGGCANVEIIDEKFGHEPILATISWVGTSNLISWFPSVKFSDGL